MRVLALVTDAYGGRGGIAQHNRHLLDALSTAPGVTEVVALPRIIVEPTGPLPDRLTYRQDAAGSKARYLRTLVETRLGASPPGPHPHAAPFPAETRPGASLPHAASFDLVVCGHLNLLALGVLAKWWFGAPLVQVVHGIEAWPAPGLVRRRLIGHVDRLVSVSDFTRRRVQAWAHLPEERTAVVPNAVDLRAFTPGPKRPDLLARYGLGGRTVLLTVARLAGRERYKGFDEVMDVLPALRAERPGLAYLIVGDGSDRARLEAKARALGLTDHVTFAGHVPEAEKADHYRLADAFVMPGRGEGFGIVYLEALACGLPVVASTADASREAVRDGAWGELADPDDAASIRAAIRGALARPRRVPEGLEHFSAAAYERRWHDVLAGAAARVGHALPVPA